MALYHPDVTHFQPHHLQVYRVDLSARQEAWTYRYGPEKVAWVFTSPLPAVPGHVHPPDYCFDEIRRSDPGVAIQGWFNRTRSVYERKSSRMFEAYVTGAISVSYLRTTLARVKLGIALGVDIGPNHRHRTDCEMDPFDEEDMPEEVHARWRSVSQHIAMDGAPTIKMTVIDTNGFSDSEMQYVGGFISGMCLDQGCGSDDLHYYVTKYADLFDTVPPLSPGQERAVVALNSLASPEYWLRVAHANGIRDDQRILEAHHVAMGVIAHAINPSRAPGDIEWTDFMGFES